MLFQWLPVIVSLALERLSIDVKISELRVMLLQIVSSKVVWKNLDIFNFFEQELREPRFQFQSPRVLSKTETKKCLSESCR